MNYSDRLRQTFSEGGAQEIYHEIKAGDEFPGVQTLCMKLAYRMCNFYPELKEEFMRIIDTMEIAYYKPAVKGLRVKILNNRSV